MDKLTRAQSPSCQLYGKRRENTEKEVEERLQRLIGSF